jgi:hypothetical protein
MYLQFAILVTHTTLVQRFEFVFFLSRFTPTEVIEFFRRMTKEAVTFRQQNNVKRNDFLQMLIDLKEKAEDMNNSKDKSIPWYKSKYALPRGQTRICGSARYQHLDRYCFYLPLAYNISQAY